MPPAADLLTLAALAALLVTAFRHPSGRVEVLVGVLAVGVVAATGHLDGEVVGPTLEHLGPVVVFLATILVVADVCAAAGVFTWAADRIGRLGGGRTTAVFTGTFVAAALVTTTLSLDATVVLLTPVVVATGLALGTSPGPGAMACLRMANSASLLLPVSNLTNLLALPHLDLGFTGFALAMAPVLTVVLVVEYAGLRLLHRRDLAASPARTLATEPLRMPRVPVVAVGLMLLGFAAASAAGLDPAWVSGATALSLTLWAVPRGLSTPARALHAAHPSFAVFVLALGLVVAALGEGVLGDDLARLVPDGTGLVDLLWIAVVGAVLSAVVTNLSATLLLVPMLAGLGDVAVLAALLGLTIGSGLTWTGSLATLLWRRSLLRQDQPASSRELHRVSLTLTPVCLLAAVTALWLTT